MPQHRVTRTLTLRTLAAVALGAGTTIAVSWSLAALLVPDLGAWTWRSVSRPNDGSGTPDHVDINRYRRLGCSHYEVSYMALVQRDQRDAGSAPPLVIERWARPLVVPWEQPESDLPAAPPSAAAQDAQAAAPVGPAPGSINGDKSGADGRWPQFFMPSNTRFAVQAREATAFGFPFPCLYHTLSATPSGTATRYTWSHRGAWFVPGTASAASRYYGVVGPIALPLRPIPLPFLVDALLFGACWWVLLAAPGSIQRARRQRRGLCSSCGYDLRHNSPGDPCPECGSVRAAPATGHGSIQTTS